MSIYSTSAAERRILDLFAANGFTPLPYASIRVEVGGQTLQAILALMKKGMIERLPSTQERLYEISHSATDLAKEAA